MAHKPDGQFIDTTDETEPVRPVGTRPPDPMLIQTATGYVEDIAAAITDVHLGHGSRDALLGPVYLLAFYCEQTNRGYTTLSDLLRNRLNTVIQPAIDHLKGGGKLHIDAAYKLAQAVAAFFDSDHPLQVQAVQLKQLQVPNLKPA
jgi:hypothetical protein